MQTQQPLKTGWPAGVLILCSLPILLIAMGIIALLASWMLAGSDVIDGVVDTTLENALLFGGLYFALPCGLINILLAIFARSRGWLDRKLAATGILIGVLGLIFGILAWASFFIVSSIVF